MRAPEHKHPDSSSDQDDDVQNVDDTRVGSPPSSSSVDQQDRAIAQALADDSPPSSSSSTRPRLPPTPDQIEVLPPAVSKCLRRCRRLLVTGGAGFIGSHFVEMLWRRNRSDRLAIERIVVVDSLEPCASIENIPVELRIGEPTLFRFAIANICDKDILRKIVEDENIDTIVHFAAQTHVDNSFGNPPTFVETNVLGTCVLLEVARYQRARSGRRFNLFLHVSTDEVYGDNVIVGDDGTRVDGPLSNESSSILQPTNPYAASKAAAEHMVRAYAQSYGLPIIITRSNNAYGPRQFPEKFIPKMILRVLEGRTCCLHGDGLQRRRYIYVDDLCEAFLTILHQGRIGQTYNIGTDCEMTNVDVARRVIHQIVGRTPLDVGDDPASAAAAAEIDRYLEYVPDRAFNDTRYAISSKSLKALGWRERTSFAKGLVRTIQWYRIRWFSQDVIDDYFRDYDEYDDVDDEEKRQALTQPLPIMTSSTRRSRLPPAADQASPRNGIQQHWPRANIEDALRPHPSTK